MEKVSFFHCLSNFPDSQEGKRNSNGQTSSELKDYGPRVSPSSVPFLPENSCKLPIRTIAIPSIIVFNELTFQDFYIKVRTTYRMEVSIILF